MYQRRNKTKPQEKIFNKMKISNLPNKEFKVIISMFSIAETDSRIDGKVVGYRANDL